MYSKEKAAGRTAAGISTYAGAADNSSNYNTLARDNATLDALSAEGVTFVYVAKRGKAPIENNWPEKPRTLAQAQAHRRTGGNVGAMAGRKSGNVIWPDIDHRFSEFLQQFPELNNTLIVYRENAPERGKLAIRVTDTLPTSTFWKVEGETSPRAELLSNGRQAVIAGIHETGAPILNNGKPIIEMSYSQVSAIWRKWTGQELKHPTAARDKRTKQAHKPTAGPQQAQTGIDEPDSLKARVKAHWSAYAVFERFGRVADERNESGGDIRLLGNGGLVVGDPNDSSTYQRNGKTGIVRERWFCHSDGIGGDQIEAWAYCTGRTVGDSSAFPAILREMAEAANIAIEPRALTLYARRVDASTGEVIETPHELPFGQAISLLIAQYSQAEPYQRGQAGRTDRAVMLAMLEQMRILGRAHCVKFDVRNMAGGVNNNFKTSAKALQRLCNEYGWLKVCDGESFFSHDMELPETDQHIVNMTNARAYRLNSRVLTVNSEVCESGTDITTGAVVTICTTFAHLDADVLNEYSDSDAFAWGARETGDPDNESLGKAALDLIAALVVQNDLGYAEIAESTGMSRSTASKKARALAALGICEVYREGRSMVVYLVSDWRAILDRTLQRLTTFCRNLKRKIGHLRTRIDRISGVMLGRDITSGRLEAKLRDMLAGWRRKLVLLRNELNHKVKRLTVSGRAHRAIVKTESDITPAKRERIAAAALVANVETVETVQVSWYKQALAA